jgi:hypothetical protein
MRESTIEPLSEASISITDLAEAVDAVSSNNEASELSTEGEDGSVSCVKLSFSASRPS